MKHPLLAAIRYAEDQDIDRVLSDFVAVQIASGLRVEGALQFRFSSGGDCHCADMDLQLIGTGKIFRISQPLGNGSTGCRLHPGMLAACSAHLETQIESGCDLLVLNRFGKGESEGRGFRDLISKALFSGVPVLTAVRSTYADAWSDFSSSMGIELPFDKSAIYTWFGDLNRTNAA
jgi:hypothetical protein